jgi:hypothetical protein
MGGIAEEFRKETGMEWPDPPGRVLTCVYCGMQYPQDTPAWGDKVLTDHIKVCEKHPMRQAEGTIRKLRKALVDLVGSDNPKELEQIEIVIRMAPVPDKDKTNMINAINALLETAQVGG